MDSPMYVYELPYSRLLELQKILDIEGKWKELGAQMDISNDDMAWIGMAFKRGSSPTEELLNKYCHSNPTVCELFRHLRRIRADRAMRSLEGFVPDRLFREDISVRNPNRMFEEKNQSFQEPSLGSDFSGLPTPTPPSHMSHNMNIASSESTLPPYQYPSQVGKESMKIYNKYKGNGMRLDSAMASSNMATISSSASTGGTSQGPSLHNWQSRPREPVESTCDTTTSQNIMPDYQGRPGSSQNQALQASGSSRMENASKDGSRASTKSISDHSETLDAAFKYIQPYELYEIEDATENFSSSLILGKGGFGVVYKGHISRLNMDVAIKKLRKPEDYQEIKALFVYRHENIIPLIGYCTEDRNMILIYRYMEQGSLEQRLLCKNNTPPLNWLQRLNILLGTAKAIHYLHNGRHEETMIHGDIKSANILIDKHFEAKIADFGLAKYATAGSTPSKNTHVTQYSPSVYGSRAYLPKEYLQDPRHLNVKTDTYSFGIVIFETCLGVQAGAAESLSKATSKFLKDVMEMYRDMEDNSLLLKLRDPKCPQWPDSQWLGTLDLGFQCTNESKKKRPEMKEVSKRLDELMKLARNIVASEKKKSVSGQSLSASEKSMNLSFESQGQGRSLGTCDRSRAAKKIPEDDLNKEFCKLNIVNPIQKQDEALMQCRKQAESFPRKLDVDEGDYLNPPGGGDEDYLHPGPQYPGGDQGDDDCIKLGLPSKKTVYHDPDDLPYDPRKLDEPGFTEDCTTNHNHQRSVNPQTAELDPEDPRFLECDSQKLRALEEVNSSDLTTQTSGPITPDSAEVRNYMIKTNEAWMVQDYYDRKHQQEEEPDSFDPCATEESICLSGDSSEGSMVRDQVVPNEYITMPNTGTRKPKKCHAPPPTPPSADLSNSSWYDSLEKKGPPAAHTKKAYQPGVPAGSSNSSYEPQVVPAPKSLYLASQSDKEEGISVRGRPSDIPTSSGESGQAEARHLSHRPEEGGLYVPKNREESMAPCTEDAHESSQKINAKKDKFKKHPFFKNWNATPRQPAEGSDGSA